MSRHERPTTELTKRALDKIVKQVAAEMDVSDDYLYAILAGYKSDSYAHFRPLFRALCRIYLTRAALYLDDLRAIYRTEEARQLLGGRFRGEARECRKECREAVDSSLDERPIVEQIREHFDAIEAHEARLRKLMDRDGAAEFAAMFDGSLPGSERSGTGGGR